jgi:hypothetical protein
MSVEKRLNTKAATIALILFFSQFFIQGSLTAAFAEEELVVSNIRAMVSEKGSTVYSLSVFAGVKNNGETRTVVIEVIAVNAAGFQVGNAILSGPVEQGQNRMLSTVIQMQKEDFESIDHWEWKKP